MSWSIFYKCCYVIKDQYVAIGLLIVFENDRLTIVFCFVKRSLLKNDPFVFSKITIVFENNPIVLNEGRKANHINL